MEEGILGSILGCYGRVECKGMKEKMHLIESVGRTYCGLKYKLKKYDYVRLLF
jgi:hypothetical protein